MPDNYPFGEELELVIDGRKYLVQAEYCLPIEGDYTAMNVAISDPECQVSKGGFHLGITGMKVAILNTQGKWSPEIKDRLFRQNLEKFVKNKIDGGPIRPDAVFKDLEKYFIWDAIEQA